MDKQNWTTTNIGYGCFFGKTFSIIMCLSLLKWKKSISNSKSFTICLSDDSISFKFFFHHNNHHHHHWSGKILLIHSLHFSVLFCVYIITIHSFIHSATKALKLISMWLDCWNRMDAKKNMFFSTFISYIYYHYYYYYFKYFYHFFSWLRPFSLLIMNVKKSKSKNIGKKMEGKIFSEIFSSSSS